MLRLFRVFILLRILLPSALFLHWTLPPLPSAFGAAPSPLNIQVFIGFNGVFKLEKWTPIRIVLENHGDSFQGTLLLQVPGGWEYPRESDFILQYTQQVYLPTHSRKSYQFTILPTTVIKPLIVTVESGGKRLAVQQIDLRKHLTLNPLILGLSKSASLDFLSLSLPSLDQAQDSRQHFGEEKELAPSIGTKLALSLSKGLVLYPRIEYLPDRWYGYEGIDLLVIQDLPLMNLEQAQYKAIEKWVLAGGTLLFVGGIHYPQFLNTPLKKLLPVKIKGLAQLSDFSFLQGDKILHPTSLEDTTLRSSSTSPGEGIPIVLSEPLGEVLLKEGGIPLLVRTRPGKGEIYFLALDISQVQALPTKSLLADLQSRVFSEEFLLSKKEFVSFKKLEGNRDDLAYKLLDLPLFSYPSHLTLGLFLLSYLLLTGLTFTRKVQFHKREIYHWLMTFGFICMFTLLALFLFNYPFLKKKGWLFHISLALLLNNRNYAEVEDHLSVFSLRKERYHLTFRSPDLALYPLPREDVEGGRGYEWSSGEDDLTLRNLTVGGWSSLAFKGKDLIPFDLKRNIKVHRTTLEVTLFNGTRHPILQSSLVYNGKVFPIGTLEPNQGFHKVIPREFTDNLEGSFRDIWYDALDEREQVVKKAILTYVFQKREAKTDIYRHDKVVFIGWLEHPLVDLEVNEDLAIFQGLTLMKGTIDLGL